MPAAAGFFAAAFEATAGAGAGAFAFGADSDRAGSAAAGIGGAAGGPPLRTTAARHLIAPHRLSIRQLASRPSCAYSSRSCPWLRLHSASPADAPSGAAACRLYTWLSLIHI